MESENTSDKGIKKPLSGIPLARRFYEIALEEFNTKDREKMKDGCEKGYRAALEALDDLLVYKGYTIDIGRPEAHQQRSKALVELITIDSNFSKIRETYNTFVTELHGMGFYSNANPELYEIDLKRVKEFIDLIEETITL